MSKYIKWYNSIIDRAKNRKIDGYYEEHHIKPLCMGGDDSKENIVDLTPEEHYVCHQLLAKIYPMNSSLIFAANMMTVHGEHQGRNNKKYGWLKRKFGEFMSDIQKDRVAVRKGNIVKKIKKEDLQNYLKNDWELGGNVRTDEHKENSRRLANERFSKKKAVYFENPDRCMFCEKELPYLNPARRKRCRSTDKINHCGGTECRSKASKKLNEPKVKEAIERKRKKCPVCGVETFNPQFCSLQCGAKGRKKWWINKE